MLELNYKYSFYSKFVNISRPSYYLSLSSLLLYFTMTLLSFYFYSTIIVLSLPMVLNTDPDGRVVDGRSTYQNRSPQPNTVSVSILL